MSLWEQIYNIKTMTQAVLSGRPPKTFLQQRFFFRQKTHETGLVQIDIKRNGQRIAPYVSSKLPGKVVEKEGYKTHEYKPPLLKPKMVTTAEELSLRMAGESPYMPATPEQRAQEKLGEELAELDGMIARRIELMCAQAIQTGKILVEGDGVKDEIDFDMRSDHKITLESTALWSASSTCLPLDNLRDWMNLINLSGAAPTDIIFGSDALKYFFKSQQIIGNATNKGLLDLKAINIGQITPEILESGATYFGRLTEIGCDMWGYPELFRSETSKKLTPMIDANRVIMLSRTADYRLHFGAIPEVPAHVVSPRFAKSWRDQDPGARYLMVQSAPLPAPHEIDSIVSAVVC